MTPLDIASREVWQNLEAEIKKHFSVNVAVFDTNGSKITDIEKWGNDLCPKIKTNKNGQLYICAVAHQHISKQSASIEDTVIDECDAGLNKVVIPLITNNKIYGFFSCCGYLSEENEIEAFIISKTANLSEREINELSKQVPIVPSQKEKAMIEFIEGRIREILNPE